MFNKKSGLGKKGSILSISAFTLVFSFVSIVYIFMSVFLFATANDYLFVPMQNLTESLEIQGVVQSGTSDLTQTFGDDFTNFNLHTDDLWLIAYLIFIISSLIVSYKTGRQNYFAFFGYLFYGVLFILFLLTFFDVITNWFNEEILLGVIPGAIVLVPKFYYYLDHVGIFSAIHLLACILVNQLDFDFAKIGRRKKQEELALAEDGSGERL